MKTNIFFSAICGAAMIIAGCFMAGCQKEEYDFWEEPSLSETYLSIENFSSKTTFSSTEQEILIEAMRRIGESSQIKDGHVVITKTAKELDIADDIYKTFETFASVFNSQQAVVFHSTVRLKG